jgi:superfamily II DNA or RNA helicase
MDEIVPNAQRFFGPGMAKAAITSCLKNAKIVRIATAFFEPTGWALLAEILEQKTVRLLVGREEGAADRVGDLLREFFEELHAGGLKEHPTVLKQLLTALRGGRLIIKLSTTRRPQSSIDVRYLYHHAKLYMADNLGVVVTSANFTRNGLEISREAGYLVSDKNDVQYFVDQFDDYFEKAESLTAEFIQALEEILELRSPNEVYCRSLLEIYGMPDDSFSGNLPSPAMYQKPIISRLVRGVTDFGGAFLVASTGLGKTIIAAHTVAILQARDLVHAVMVFAPAGLKDMWSKAMRSARVSSREFSYQILSVDDWKRYRQALLLDDELKNNLNGVLLILDESHHMRNDEDSKKDSRLRHRRIDSAVKKGAQVLMLTATPYSRDVQDINNQLKLLPRHLVKGEFFETRKKWNIDTPKDLAELAPCTVLTAPTVIKHFSHTDINGRRYVEFGNDRRLFFPEKIHLKTIKYANAYNSFLRELKQSNLLRKRTISEYESDLFADSGISGKIDYLFEARLLHQFCSSAAQVKVTLDKLSREGGYDKMRFEAQEQLTVLASALLHRINKIPDEKISRLTEIVREHAGEKMVIFCIYKETAKELTKALSDVFPALVIRSTVDLDPDDLDNVLDFFAPIANDKIQPNQETGEFYEKIKENRIDILIASEAISEGFNLQDARILINYDLPWSILQLAQRMGRLMRPWHEPRELLIFNFLPDTMYDAELRHGETWLKRLDKRNKEHQSFANLPVLFPPGNEAVNLESLSNALQHFDSADLELDEAMSFIGNATQVETSSVLDDLAQMPQAEHERIRRIRSGFRSRVVRSNEDPALFLLISVRSSIFPALFKPDGSFFLPPQEISRPLEILRKKRFEPIMESNLEPVLLEDFQEKCLKMWLHEFGETREKVRVVCALFFD